MIDPSGNFAIALPLLLPGVGEVAAVGAGAAIGWAMNKILPTNGPPNGTIVIPDRSSGGKKQERHYGPNGVVIKDIDWGHDHGAGSPHVHDWELVLMENQVRGGGRPAKEGECK